MEINWTNIWEQIGTATVIVTIVSYTVKTIFDKSLAHGLNKSLEEHKVELNKLSQSFTLYNTKKHDVLRDFYQQVLYTEGAVMSLYGRIKSLTYQEYNEEDIKDHLTENKVPKGKTEEILTLLANNRQQALETMREYLRMIHFQQVEIQLQETYNALLLSELYLSEEEFDKGEELLTSLSGLYVIYKKCSDGTATAKEAAQMDKDKEWAQRLRTELKTMITKELRKGN